MIYPRIFSMYLSRKLYTALSIISPIVIAMVWLTISIRHISLIVSNDVSLSTFFRIILCTWPDIAGVILPVCAIIASIVVIHRMQSDKELLVFMTSGGSLFAILKPILLFASVISVSVFFIQTTLTPYSHRHLIRLQERIHSQISMSAIRQGVFNVVGDSVVYIGRKSKNAIEDIFISYVPNGGKRNTNIIAAKSGDYILKDNKLFIRLKKGYRQELDKNNSIISMLSFNNFSYNVSQFVRQYSARVNKVYENTQDELLTMASKTNNPRLKNKYLAEFHGRIIMSFTPLINSLIVSIFMLAAWVYRKRSLLAFQAFLCSVIFQIMIMTLVNTSSKHESLIIINYIIILLMILGLFIILFRKKVS